MASETKAFEYATEIQQSGLSIYDEIKVGDPKLWVPPEELEILLKAALKGKSLAGLPLRTRSKKVKSLVSTALGYPIPKSFKRTNPRFLGQNFDVYTQKSNNLQIWNEEISPTRRYAIIKVSEHDIIETVKVIDGETLAQLDTTGTLTQKYQAKLSLGERPAELVSPADTANLQDILSTRTSSPYLGPNPAEPPTLESIVPIQEVFEKLVTLLGQSFDDLGAVQERNRGAEVHRRACFALGYKTYKDDGRFPDIRNQLLEVKLQTSPTIDLGLVRPDSSNLLDIPMISGRQLRHCDVRYALLSAVSEGGSITLTHLFLTTGQDFFTRFNIFEGKGLNKKLQIPLPADFFLT